MNKKTVVKGITEKKVVVMMKLKKEEGGRG